MRWYFLIVSPLLIHGVAAAISQIAIVATIAHMTSGLMALLLISFIVSTMRQYGREALEHQKVRVKMQQLEIENAQLKVNTQANSEYVSNDNPPTAN
jgi:acyl-CoA thioesterase FadM